MSKVMTNCSRNMARQSCWSSSPVNGAAHFLNWDSKCCRQTNNTIANKLPNRSATIYLPCATTMACPLWSGRCMTQCGVVASTCSSGARASVAPQASRPRVVCYQYCAITPARTATWVLVRGPAACCVVGEVPRLVPMIVAQRDQLQL